MHESDIGYAKVCDALDTHTNEINDYGVFRSKDLKTQAVMLGCVVDELSRIADALENQNAIMGNLITDSIEGK